MDRGKRKMTADDIASERQSELRNSHIARGEGLRLQPSAEFLNARYIGPTENMWTVSAPMPTIFPQPVSTVHPMLPTSGPIPIWTANPWTTSPSVPVPMGFAPQTTIGSTTTIPTSCPLLPNSLLQEMEHLNMFAPQTVHDIRSELYKGLRDVSSQSASPWTVPSSAYAPTSSMFQATDVTPCNSQASIPMSASSVSSQQIKQLTVTPQPLPINGDQSWDCYITPSMIKPVPSWPFGAMGRPCFCEGSWHFIVADDGREAYLDERSFLRIMSRGGI